MLQRPSGRKRKRKDEKINLIPILDAVFIFIFFLLMSANFLKVYEIQSDVPIISDAKPPKNPKKELALTITIKKKSIVVSTGTPSMIRKVFKQVAGDYPLNKLHEYLIQLKKKHMDEKTAILEPKYNHLEYAKLIEIMDSIRLFKDTDEAFFKKDKDGISQKVEALFSNIVFANIMS
jgi:biopolymer transport protein ExbD